MPRPGTPDQGRGPQALAWEREHEAKAQAQMAKAMVVTPPCAVCGTPSARIELVTPGQLPAKWEQWPSTVQASISRQREPGQWYLLFQGVAAYNGYGDPIDASQAGRIVQRSRLPCASPRSTRPGSTTMQDSARTATRPTATATGTYPRAATATAPAATARAWTRTGKAKIPRARRCADAQLDRKR